MRANYLFEKKIQKDYLIDSNKNTRKVIRREEERERLNLVLKKLYIIN